MQKIITIDPKVLYDKVVYLNVLKNSLKGKTLEKPSKETL